MDVEDLGEVGSGAPAREPERLDVVRSRLPWWGWAGLVLVVVVAGLLAVRGGGDAPPRPAPTPAPTSTPATVPGAPQFLALGEICRPVTDHRTRLRVSFFLVNYTGYDVTVDRVAPHLPLAGLRLRDMPSSGGTCARPGSRPAEAILFPGQERLFTFDFTLPRDCPQPYPVQAHVDQHTPDGVGRHQNVPIYPDLGGIAFFQCHLRS